MTTRSASQCRLHAGAPWTQLRCSHVHRHPGQLGAPGKLHNRLPNASDRLDFFSADTDGSDPVRHRNLYKFKLYLSPPCASSPGKICLHAGIETAADGHAQQRHAGGKTQR